MAHLKPRRGFTLIEVLVSMVILSFGLIALSQLYMAATWSYQKARYLSIATQRANFELEMVRNLEFLMLQNGPTELGAAYPSSEYTPLPSPRRGVTFDEEQLPEGTGTVEWSYYPTPSIQSNIFKVVIDINWKGSVRAQTKVHIITFVAEGI